MKFCFEKVCYFQALFGVFTFLVLILHFLLLKYYTIIFPYQRFLVSKIAFP